MKFDDRSDRVCLIGAGYTGNGLAYALKRAGIVYDQLEATDRIGGNWAHGVYDSTHLISSKRSTQYTEYPMPEHYPTFPSRAQMLSYLESYVEHFGLGDSIEFGTEVARVSPVDDNGSAGWLVELSSGETRCYRAVAIANGHYWQRNIPDYPGEFTGRQLHSKDYKRPEDFGSGDRVLVVGAGNSASDIAVEASATYGAADISMRRGYWFIPKTIFGIPSSEYDRVWCPLPLQRMVFKQLLRLSYGDYRKYGLQRPDHKLFTRDVTVNSSLMYALQHGKVRPRPEINRFDGTRVHFTDGSSDDYDTVVWATGFRTRFPMLDESMFVWDNDNPLLVEHVLVPRYANIYLWGLVAPRSGAGRIISEGSAFLAEAVAAQGYFDEPLSDVVARWVKARSSMLAGSAEILGRIKILRRALRILIARTIVKPRSVSISTTQESASI
ncbi:putative flavin-containing monooxygenase [Gordonia effusa NBRC 100432]|uniref:Putative flavin-containing monooxygenase n=1 Tax=Gordonia effusa NBRC 100432 TaxID=1077974 RepID=H0QVY4_9ACTN|nr:NAD(P)-binding domain-containing protein [Gordonia effusa]GAB16985.1 putative flavin-containing monooxygenase [Gordonia effusa NBRC 100432]